MELNPEGQGEEESWSGNRAWFRCWAITKRLLRLILVGIPPGHSRLNELDFGSKFVFHGLIVRFHQCTNLEKRKYHELYHSHAYREVIQTPVGFFWFNLQA